jgi:hypothetical protein
MKKNPFVFAVSFLVLFNVPALVLAQSSDEFVLPDPETIVVPDVSPSSDPRVERQGHKFFYFNNPDVTFAQAYSDFAECRQHLVRGAIVTTPGFVPWVEPARITVKQQFNPQYGLAGAVIGSILLNHLERGYRANKMRLCMGPRGYRRYAITEASWEKLNQAEDAQILLMLAKIASASKPLSGEVAE